MADQHDNVVLVLLREIRAVQDDQGSRLRHIETRIDEMHEAVGRAKALPATSSSSGLRRAHLKQKAVGTSVPTLRSDASETRV